MIWRKLIDSFKKAQLVIWSFPLYHGCVPAKMKTFLDRTIPIFRPVIGPAVEPNDRKHILISSCGYIFPHSYKVSNVCVQFW